MLINNQILILFKQIKILKILLNNLNKNFNKAKF